MEKHKTFNKKSYTLSEQSCSYRAEAKGKAQRVRARGISARVVKENGKYYIYTLSRGKKK